MVLSLVAYFIKCHVIWEVIMNDVCKGLEGNGHGPPEGYYPTIQLGTIRKAMTHFN
jgi:hypothetical protein